MDIVTYFCIFGATKTILGDSISLSGQFWFYAKTRNSNPKCPQNPGFFWVGGGVSKGVINVFLRLQDHKAVIMLACRKVVWTESKFLKEKNTS